MTRTQIMMLVIVVLAAALIAVLVLRNKQPPILPTDSEHASYSGPVACLECHGTNGGLPISPNHPPVREECLRCHGKR